MQTIHTVVGAGLWTFGILYYQAVYLDWVNIELAVVSVATAASLLLIFLGRHDFNNAIIRKGIILKGAEEAEKLQWQSVNNKKIN